MEQNKIQQQYESGHNSPCIKYHQNETGQVQICFQVAQNANKTPAVFVSSAQPFSLSQLNLPLVTLQLRLLAENKNDISLPFSVPTLFTEVQTQAELVTKESALQSVFYTRATPRYHHTREVYGNSTASEQ